MLHQKWWVEQSEFLSGIFKIIRVSNSNTYLLAVKFSLSCHIIERYFSLLYEQQCVVSNTNVYDVKVIYGTFIVTDRRRRTPTFCYTIRHGRGLKLTVWNCQCATIYLIKINAFAEGYIYIILCVHYTRERYGDWWM